MIPVALQIEMARTQTTDCTQSRKKLRLKSRPERTYLFVTVIRIEEPQYAKMAITGFSVIEELLLEERITGDGAREALVELMP